ncbi:TetR family transcriptional regulator [Anaerocolumna cellulosilytica]|uniref:TetR family transcriptional regulator n=1 Tax=Anaerocolumna cellulosilytica TaxID=433286 RepID=A0A6S6QXW9_9FIRM|nr:TetR/AcrR family transcriptional regulator [Anaerocolumna cellulosilytica]MBB5195110.1 AcrR family transcriptional regulator [Anaerocolumna cellulosilytica]BCJ96053.1 TetR family transcriptional regulator [Anaerocolumna cellulosilytica]
MPKTYSDSERAYIKKRLMDEAYICLAQFGVRKTTVDELVKRVNIPKGTFYLFYPSKELLFFDVFCSLHNELQTTLLHWIEELQGNINTDTITDLIYRLYKQVDSTFIYTFIANGDLELLVRKLPPELAATHAQEDDFAMRHLLSLLPGTHTEDTIKIFSAVLRAIFCTMLHKREIGEHVFDDTIRVMLRGVVLQLFEEDTL